MYFYYVFARYILKKLKSFHWFFHYRFSRSFEIHEKVIGAYIEKYHRNASES
ncbi:hypothetical protein DDT56_16650 [Brenneria corticis]|uniref:Uncharacterized protein n=1 Tax=Brenneria corticis TaxID=2173106 RepID=A0A2U1TU37_9GAMM|nr:hypothetical protein DDT56_16650 [Brenneria sp. CFCC 11842]